jgi:hypothetical protein
MAGRPEKYYYEIDKVLLLKTITEYKVSHNGNSPTIRELMALNGISSMSTMQDFLCRLHAEGKIGFDYSRARSITLPGWVLVRQSEIDALKQRIGQVDNN